MPRDVTYTELELRRAYDASGFPKLDISFERACEVKHYRGALEMIATLQRRRLQTLAQRAERERAGRWLEAGALDAYEITDRDAHFGEVPA